MCFKRKNLHGQPIISGFFIRLIIVGSSPSAYTIPFTSTIIQLGEFTSGHNNITTGLLSINLCLNHGVLFGIINDI